MRKGKIIILRYYMRGAREYYFGKAMRKIKYYARRRADGEEWESAVITAEYFAALTGRRVEGDVELFSGNAMTERHDYVACSGGEFLGVYHLEKIF